MLPLFTDSVSNVLHNHSVVTIKIPPCDHQVSLKSPLRFQEQLDFGQLSFIAQLLVGLFALMRLGELTYPDDKKLRNPLKVSKRTTVVILKDSFQFFLLTNFSTEIRSFS